jgi:uncharacterized protein
MKVNVKRIPLEGEQLRGTEPGTIVELETDDVRFEAPVEYDVLAQIQGQALLVTGKLRTRAQMRCSRCLRVFEQRLAVVDFVFHQELTGEDFVDLTPQIREDIILALPQRALCERNCKGLCPVCGKDLNKGACGCQVHREDLRWHALDQLKLK